MSSPSSDSSARDRAAARATLRPIAALLAATAVLGLAAWLRRGAIAPPEFFAAPPGAAELQQEITDQFGMQNPLVWIVEPRDGVAWRRSVLTRVADMTREVLALPGVIATDVISIASPNMRDLRLTDDGLEPVYLMSEVPKDDLGIAALRAHVDGDPSYAGNLVTRDGRAAIIAANFLPDIDPAALAQAALALRDRNRDAATDVWTVGAAVMAAQAPAAAAGLAWPLAIAAAAALASALLILGARATGAAALASLLATAWTALALIALGAISLPWSIAAALPIAVLAAGLALTGGDRGARRREVVAGLALGAGGIGFAIAAGAPSGALSKALAVGAVFAVAAARIVTRLGYRTAFESPGDDSGARGPRPALALVAVALAALGLARLSASFGLPGYGERYLPASAGEDLRAMRRLMPPPSMLVVRLRGESGFVARPDVLGALAAAGDALKSDPAVRDVQSLADVVKRVNRAFNDDDPKFNAIPDDRGLNARYLALAYSPLFRRFVDRSLASTALWVLIAGDRTADLARVQGELAASLAAHPLADVTIDPIAGDGTSTLAMAEAARHSARATAVALLALVAAGWLASGVGAGLGVALSGAAAGIAAAGVLGWLGLALDLLTLSSIEIAALASALIALLRGAGAARAPLTALGMVLIALALPLLLWPAGATRALAVALLGPILGAAIAFTPSDRPSA